MRSEWSQEETEPRDVQTSWKAELHGGLSLSAGGAPLEHSRWLWTPHGCLLTFPWVTLSASRTSHSAQCRVGGVQALLSSCHRRGSTSVLQQHCFANLRCELRRRPRGAGSVSSSVQALAGWSRQIVKGRLGAANLPTVPHSLCLPSKVTLGVSIPSLSFLEYLRPLKAAAGESDSPAQVPGILPKRWWTGEALPGVTDSQINHTE